MEREYKYFLHRKKDPFVRKYSWFCGYGLDVGKMNEAASKLLGRHDFKCFQKIGSDNKTSVCTVTKAVWESFCKVGLAPMLENPSRATRFFSAE